MLKENARSLLATLSRHPAVWNLLIKLNNYRHRRKPWNMAHEFDAYYGVETAGFVPFWMLGGGTQSDSDITAYVGCQPSALRWALRSIPTDNFTFLDLGCGKG